MFPILILSVIAILVLAVLRKKNTEEQEEVIRQFWETENKANQTPKKNLDELSYITIPLDLFPLGLDTDSEKALVDLADKRILNLENKTNTELKMEYGVSNLETLTEYENNFITLQQIIEVYSNELEAADRYEDAISILEFAISVGADKQSLFLHLASLYRALGEEESIEALIGIVENSTSLTKASLLDKLHNNEF